MYVLVRIGQLEKRRIERDSALVSIEHKVCDVKCNSRTMHLDPPTFGLLWYRWN